MPKDAFRNRADIIDKIQDDDGQSVGEKDSSVRIEKMMQPGTQSAADGDLFQSSFNGGARKPPTRS